MERKSVRENLEAISDMREPKGILGSPAPGNQRRGGERIRVGYHGGAVIMNFGGEMGAVGLHPDQAKELARQLLRHASPVTR